MPMTTTDPALDRLVRRIVERVDPVAIYLFGSLATGEADEESGYDLLIVVDDGFPPGQATVSTALAVVDDLALPVDALMVRVGEFERRRHEVGTLSYEVGHRGRRIYDRGQRSRVA